MTRRRIPYMPEELAWIEARGDWPRDRLHSAFCFMFDRTDVSQENIKQLCNRKGWRAGPEGRQRLKGTSRVFSADEMAWLRANAHLTLKDTGPAFRAAFGRNEITDEQVITWRRNHKVRTGRTGRFDKGQTPPNKGKKGFCPPGSEKGWFQKGARSGVATKLYQPIGTERVRDGYLFRKVNDDMPLQRRWRMVQMINWEALHGPIPEGHVLKCLDANPLNCDPSNWACIPRGMLPRLNSRHGRNFETAPAEVKPTIMAIAKLEHAAHKARKAGQA